ncbi:MAG: DUF5814 domain-containing protein [Halobacteria archaeon]|nr:DUF5814 domain-containing protein [Halobacteria archaeon]
MAITDRIYIKNAYSLGQQIDKNLPRNVFHGAALDILYSSDAIEKLDPGTREQFLNFIEDFMDCGCEDAPFCGHPEEKFIRHLLELREQGHGPKDIVESLEAEYNLYAYTGDILDFLDSSVRYLEAVEEIADTLNEEGAKKEAERLRRELVGR